MSGPGADPGARPTGGPDWAALYERHGPELSAFAYRLTADREVARDIVQDTFVRAIKRGAANVREPRAWLYRIAANLAADRRRRRALIAFVPFLGSEPAPETSFEAAAQVRRALGTIPTDQAVALVLAYHEGFSRAEIATMVGVGEETVRTRIHRGRAAFAAAYRRLERGLA